MIVVITDEARSDLIRIGDYIALDNPRRAAGFVNELVESCLELADMPRAFSVVPRYANLEIRRRVHGKYIIFYRVGAETIDVIHILGGAQDHHAILFPEDN